VGLGEAGVEVSVVLAPPACTVSMDDYAECVSSCELRYRPSEIEVQCSVEPEGRSCGGALTAPQAGPEISQRVFESHARRCVDSLPYSKMASVVGPLMPVGTGISATTIVVDLLAKPDVMKRSPVNVTCFCAGLDSMYGSMIFRLPQLAVGGGGGALPAATVTVAEAVVQAVPAQKVTA
jgi:hypothetical protein